MQFPQGTKLMGTTAVSFLGLETPATSRGPHPLLSFMSVQTMLS